MTHEILSQNEEYRSERRLRDNEGRGSAHHPDVVSLMIQKVGWQQKH